MILCDNIIFELQAVGGISRAWAKTIERLDRVQGDLQFCEGPRARDNVFRRALRLTRPIVSEKGPSNLRRFCGPTAPSDVFHSSYYRISKHARFNVVTIHDFMNEMFPSSWRDPLLARLKRKACRHADRIVVVSEHTRQDLLLHYPEVDPKIVEVLYNGVDDDFFPEPRTAPIEVGSHSVQPGRYFLYVGTRGHCKNFPYVLAFLAEARSQGLDQPLLIVGGGPLSRDEHLLAGKLGLPGEALLAVSGLDNASLRALYSNASALLIPSLYEGFGLPALEAAQCGTLVLSSRGSALTEIVGETQYSFDLGRKGETARILSLGLHGAAAAAERARLTARAQSFTWDRSALRLAEIYDDLDRR